MVDTAARKLFSMFSQNQAEEDREDEESRKQEDFGIAKLI